MNGISAWRYIKNNKRRVSVLVVSLTLCFVLLYVMKFLLTTSNCTYSFLYTGLYSKMQHMALSGGSITEDYSDQVSDMVLDEREVYYEKINQELVQKLKEDDRISDAFFAPGLYIQVNGLIGSVGATVPLVSREKVTEIADLYDAELSEGKMPENPGEVAVSQYLLNNQDMKIGGSYLNYADYKITGVLECDGYLAIGIPAEEYGGFSKRIYTVSDVEDIRTVMSDAGITIRDSYDGYYDLTKGKEDLKKEVTDVMETSSSLVSRVVFVMLFIALSAVYTVHLRDRRSEWCLYSSIGFSSEEIYFSIMRELLITFGIAVFFGILVTGAAVTASDMIFLKPHGILSEYWKPDVFVMIISAYILFIGILQIPVVYALHRIRTIDSADDEMI